MVTMIFGGILLFVSAIFALVILINAFKESVGQGLLCMFVPLYILYYAFARYSGSKKGLVITGWLGANAVGVTLILVGGLLAANDAVAEYEGQVAALDDIDFAAPPAGAGAAGEENARVMSCNLSEQPGRTCMQYQIGGGYTQQAAGDHCEMVQVMADDKLPLADGPCPTDNAIAKCEPRFGNQTTFYYEDPDVDNAAAMNAMETLCTGTFSRL